MNRKYLDDLARIVTKAGVLLLENGAEVYRVEETMYRLCEYFGCSTIDSYATPSLIMISFTLDGELSHNIKRIKERRINLEKVDMVNDLSRKTVSEKLSLDELGKGLNEIEERKPYPVSYILFGSFISCGGFALAFGGGIREIISASLISLVVRVMIIFMSRMNINDFFRDLFGAFTLTAIGMIVGRMGLANGDLVIGSTIMLLVPGLAITNAIRDSINGDTNSSMIRFMEAVFVAIAIGLGSGIAYFFIRSIL